MVRGLHKVVAAALLLASGLVGSPARKQSPSLSTARCIHAQSQARRAGVQPQEAPTEVKTTLEFTAKVRDKRAARVWGRP